MSSQAARTQAILQLELQVLQQRIAIFSSTISHNAAECAALVLEADADACARETRIHALSRSVEHEIRETCAHLEALQDELQLVQIHETTSDPQKTTDELRLCKERLRALEELESSKAREWEHQREMMEADKRVLGDALEQMKKERERDTAVLLLLQAAEGEEEATSVDSRKLSKKIVILEAQLRAAEQERREGALREDTLVQTVQEYRYWRQKQR